jgi:hypothetical protein
MCWVCCFAHWLHVLVALFCALVVANGCLSHLSASLEHTVGSYVNPVPKHQLAAVEGLHVMPMTVLALSLPCMHSASKSICDLTLTLPYCPFQHAHSHLSACAQRGWL